MKEHFKDWWLGRTLAFTYFKYDLDAALDENQLAFGKLFIRLLLFGSKLLHRIISILGFIAVVGSTLWFVQLVWLRINLPRIGALPIKDVAQFLFSWPTVTLVLGLVLLVNHKIGLESLFRRAAKFKTPGGFEYEALQGDVDESSRTDQTQELISKNQTLQQYIEQLEHGHLDLESYQNETERMRKENESLKAQLSEANGRSILYEFQYINTQLAGTTRYVISILAGAGSEGISSKKLNASLPDEWDDSERRAVFDALALFGLGERRERSWILTVKGTAFVSYYGFRPIYL